MKQWPFHSSLFYSAQLFYLGPQSAPKQFILNNKVPIIPTISIFFKKITQDFIMAWVVQNKDRFSNIQVRIGAL